VAIDINSRTTASAQASYPGCPWAAATLWTWVNSRYGDKTALVLAGREIAHCEAPGVIDLRVTWTGWSQAQDSYAADPAVRRDPSRRDWIELHLSSAADLEWVRGLLVIAMAANS
jgi:hypothetical protein